MCIFSFQLLPRNTSHRLHFSFLLYFCIGVCVCVLAWQTMLGPFFFIFLVSLLQSFQHPSTCLGNDTIYTHAQDPQLIATWHTEKKKENWAIKKKTPTTSLKMKLMKPYKGSRPCPSLCYWWPNLRKWIRSHNSVVFCLYSAFNSRHCHKAGSQKSKCSFVHSSLVPAFPCSEMLWIWILTWEH